MRLVYLYKLRRQLSVYPKELTLPKVQLPICLLVLQVSGASMMLFAILLITVIHLIEAYILNPRVYGHHLRMNPVVVLIILTLGGKLFHVWGLILGVPVCNYLFSHAIRYRESERVG